MVEGGLKNETLDHSFQKLMVVAGCGGGMKMGGGGVITEWKDIPMELLLRIVSLVDDRSVIVASGVCSGWRDAICWGLTRLSLSWYFSNSLPYFHLLILITVVLLFLGISRLLIFCSSLFIFCAS